MFYITTAPLWIITSLPIALHRGCAFPHIAITKIPHATCSHTLVLCSHESMPPVTGIWVINLATETVIIWTSDPTTMINIYLRDQINRRWHILDWQKNEHRWVRSNHLCHREKLVDFFLCVLFFHVLYEWIIPPWSNVAHLPDDISLAIITGHRPNYASKSSSLGVL